MGWLLVLRHGPAEAGRVGGSDADRALTPMGRSATQAALEPLGAWCPDRILTSPYRRARQTAELLAERFPMASVPIEPWEVLEPGGDPVRVALELQERWGNPIPSGGWALVSHLPLVSDLVEHLTRRRMTLAPAGWALLVVEEGRFRLAATSEDRS